MIRSIGAVIMAICLIISCSPVTFLADKTTTDIPEDAIYISTVEDVLALAEMCKVNTWSVGKTVVLNSDIDMSEVDFYGIPTFGGVFIGKGFTIKGLNLKEDGSVVGFFRYLQKTAVVENVKLEGTVMPGGSRSSVGAIAGKNAGTIRNCSFKGTISGNQNIGGLVGVNETSGVIEDSVVSGLVYGTHFVGGIAGENHGVIRNTTNYASVNNSSVQNAVDLEDVTIDSLIHTENASTTTDIGGIAGSNSGVIRRAINHGAVGYPHMGYNIGGIAGTQNGYIVECINHGQIEGRKEVGGIVGHMEPNLALNFDTDSIQILTTQMNSMEQSIGKLEHTLKSQGQDADNQLSGLESEMNNLQNALDAYEDAQGTGELDVPEDLEVPEDFKDLGELEDMELPEDWEIPDVSEDQMDAAINDMSSSLGAIYDESLRIQQENASTMTEVANQMSDVLSQMEQMMISMSNMEENLGVSIEDISDFDTDEDTLGKVANCINHGNVSGDLNVGGITGTIAEENDLDVYQDAEVTGSVSLNATYKARAVIRNCMNKASISVNKQNAGGIVGSMMIGAVLDCMNLGNMDALNADYVGGIAGDSESIIRNCGNKSILAGDAYVGGIAGEAKTVTGCYAFVEIAAYTEKAGAVVGFVEKIPSDSQTDVSNNIYFGAGEIIGGIDGISYTGATDEVDLMTFLQMEGLNDVFKSVNVIFKADGEATVERKIPVGESLMLKDVPTYAVEEGNEYDWLFVPPVTSEVLAMGEIADDVYISEEMLTNILFDQVYEIFSDTKGSVVSASDRTDNNLSILLAVGSFAKNTTVEMQDMMGTESLIVNDKTAIVNYQVSFSNAGVETLHYLLPEGVKGDEVRLFVKGTSENWAERDFVVEGSYIVFPFTAEDIGFALIEDTGSLIGKVAVVAGIMMTTVGIIVLCGKKRRK